MYKKYFSELKRCIDLLDIDEIELPAKDESLENFDDLEDDFDEEDSEFLENELDNIDDTEFDEEGGEF